MKYIIQIVTITVVLFLLNSCVEKKDNKTEKPKHTEYKTMKLAPRQISGNIQLPGVLQPYEFVQLFPKVSGFIKVVTVDRGSLVKKGQILITLEAPEVEQQVAAAKLRYTQAQATYLTTRDRYRRLLETSNTPGTVSPYDLTAALSKMQGDSAMAQGELANYRAQESMKSYLTITAPFDGVITERNVHPGALAGPGVQSAKPMLILQQLNKLRLIVNVPEQYAAQINNGDIVHYKTNAIPGKVFDGTVSRSAQSLSTNYRAETIEIDVQNTEGQFKSGMYTEVVLPTKGNANAYVVSRSAVITTTERKYVIIVAGNKAKWVDVSEGSQSSDSTEIFGLLNSGDIVITDPSYRIKDGADL